MNWWRVIYNLVIVPVTYALARFTALFNLKVRENLQARINYLRRIEVQSRGLATDKPRAWFHCASMGEYEALVPLLEEIQLKKSCQVVLTFFSTSGLHNFKDFHLVDLVAFAPLDFRRDVRRFLDLVQPDLYIITKHDIWPNTLWEVQRRKIPALLINGNFHPGTLRLKPVFRDFFQELFSCFDTILPVTPAAAEKFRQLLPFHNNIIAPGETRYDRVLQRLQASRAQSDTIPTGFLEGNFIFIAGSTWPPGQHRLLKALAPLFEEFPQLRLIIVPHEPLPAAISHLEGELTARGLSVTRYSQLSGDATVGLPQVIIVDKVGLLAGLYRHASAAYVGGGFTTGVHSVIEPAAFAVPVLFGPRFGVSAEATQLLTDGGGFVVDDPATISALVRGWLEDPATLAAAGQLAAAVVNRNSGTTGRIHELLLDRLKQVRKSDATRSSA